MHRIRTSRSTTSALARSTEHATRAAGSGAILFAALGPLFGVGDLALSQGQIPQDKAPFTGQMPQINPNGLTSSAVCGECHQAIHAVWRQSMHANAWSNGVFQAGYRRSIDAYGPQKARACLACHAPTVRYSKDFAVHDPITAEGITCDFCHSVSAVDLSDPTDPIRLSVGKTKFGPLRHAQSPAHKIIDTELHTRSEFCAACHEYRNPIGVQVLGTYSEWKSSSYAKRGKQCQDCHMPLVPGRVAALFVKRDTPDSVNMHNISGSHDITRVRKAVTMAVIDHEWIGDQVWVYVKVANLGSGHCFPTGMPMHRAVLELTVRSGGSVLGHREIPFESVMLDKGGRVLRREHEVLMRAARVRSDTRLKPEETRIIDVVFRDIPVSRLVLTADLYYEYSTETLVADEGASRFEPVEMRFLVATERKNIRRIGG